MNQCSKCDKRFKSISHLKRHLNRKTTCEKQILICTRCNKQFLQKSKYYRHIERTTACDKIYMENLQNDEMERVFKSVSLQMVDVIKEEVSELKEELKAELNKKSQNITNNTMNNTMNINVIMPRAFGDENYDYITKNQLTNLCKSGIVGVTKLLSLVYFNKDHPENHSLYFPNNRSNKIYASDGQKFCSHDVKTVSESAFFHFTNFLEEQFDRLKRKYPELKEHIGSLDNEISAIIYREHPNGEKIFDKMRNQFLNSAYDNNHLSKPIYQISKKQKERHEQQLLNQGQIKAIENEIRI